MNKRPAFQFYPGDWRRDTQVQMSTMETRGVWFEMLCCMHDASERGKLSGTHTQLVTLLGCKGDELTRSLKEIEALHIGDVTHCNDGITITNRRMYNEDQAEIKVREQTKKRVAKHRAQETSNGKVTPPSSTSSSTSVTKTKKEDKIYYAEFVSMTNTEHSKLIEKHGEALTNKTVEVLDNYKGSSGKKYTSDYRAILSWVVERVLGESQGGLTEQSTGGMVPKPTCDKCKKQESVGQYDDGPYLCRNCWPNIR